MQMLAFAVFAGSLSSGDGGASAMRDPLAVVDSLFNAGRFDSVLVLAPSVLDDARAGKDSILIGRVLTYRGRAELAVRRYREGLESLDHAIQISEAARDTINWMDALGFKGFAITWQGRYEECMRLNKKKLSLALATHNRVAEAWARTALGYVFLQQGKLDQAKTEYKLATDIFRAEGLKRAELTPLIGLGRVYNSLQEIDAARDCYQRVLTKARELGDLVQESHAVNNLGTLEYVYGDMSLAAQYFERAYELNKTMGDMRGTITPASNIALARSYLGNYDEAANILSAAIRTCEEHDYKALLGTVQNKQGEVRLLQKRYNAAAGMFQRSLDLGNILSNKQRHEALIGLAVSLAKRDSLGTAIDLLSSGLESSPNMEHRIMSGLHLSGYLRKNGREEEALDRLQAVEEQIGEAGDIKMKLSMAFEYSACYGALGMPAESYEWYLRALDIQDERRRTSSGYEFREVLTGTWYMKDQCRIVLDYPPESPEAERVEALFNIFQRFKARTLIERITEPRHQSDPASDFSKLQAITLSELQKRVLKPGELFLDFVVGNEESYLFAVTADSCRLVILPGRKFDFADKIELYSGTMGKRPRNRPDGGTNIELSGMHETLGDLILGEISDMVRDASYMLIAPDLYINAIPFGTLVLPGDTGAGEALCESKEIHWVPSATVLRWLRVKPGGDREEARSSRIMVVAPGEGVRLKGAEKEVKFLQRKFYGVDIAEGGKEEFFREEGAFGVIHVATHIEINDEKAWHSGILLGRVDPPRAGHTTAEDVIPVNTRAGREMDFTAPVDTSRGAALEFQPDPYLRAGEIAAGRISAQLVVLSGCESALGPVIVSEGVLGLTAAFLSAGASAVVATLWPVDDAVTADLMKLFYSNLAKGESVAAALRSAQLTIRRRRDTRHPFHWAGFIVIGDGNVTVNLEEKQSISLLRYILILIVLAALFTAAWIHARRNRIKNSIRGL